MTKNIEKKSLYAKYRDKEITSKEIHDFHAKNQGFNNSSDYYYARKHKLSTQNEVDLARIPQKKRQVIIEKFKIGEMTLSQFRDERSKINGYKNYKDQIDKHAQSIGYKDDNDFRECWAKENGYKSLTDYKLHNDYKLGKNKPMSKNKSCAQYLGVHIAERVLSHVFEDIKRMPLHNHGYDFICKKGHKIEVKSGCIRKGKHLIYWQFNINKNAIADYFLLLAFDNRTDLNPMHIWLIKGTDIVGIIEKSELNKHNIFHLSNKDKSILSYKKYELIDKLDKVIDCCDTLKDKEDK